MTGSRDGACSEKRQAGLAAVPCPFWTALWRAASRAWSGRPRSSSASSITSSQAFVASRTFSEYFCVRRASSDCTTSRRAFFSPGKSAPCWRKSASVSSRKRRCSPVNAAAEGRVAAAFSRSHSSGLSGMRAKNADTCGNRALCASRNAGESATDIRCVTLAHASFSRSVACSNARNVLPYSASAIGRAAIAARAASASARAAAMAGPTRSEVSCDQRIWKDRSRKGFSISR